MRPEGDLSCIREDYLEYHHKIVSSLSRRVVLTNCQADQEWSAVIVESLGPGQHYQCQTIANSSCHQDNVNIHSYNCM